MPEYPYTDTEERVFSDLCHGPDVRVRRDGELLDIPEGDVGSTVVLRPGDVLITADPLPFFHAFLEGSALPAERAEEAPAEDTPEAQPVPEAPARRKRAAGNDTPTETAPADTPPLDAA